MKGTIRLDTTKEGMTAIWKPWEQEVLKCLFFHNGTAIGTKEIWDYATKTHSISRASVIGFVQNLHYLDLLEGEQVSGRGGVRFDYRFKSDRTGFDKDVLNILMQSLTEAFNDLEPIDFATAINNQ